jgi:hypothetical protein
VEVYEKEKLLRFWVIYCSFVFFTVELLWLGLKGLDAWLLLLSCSGFRSYPSFVFAALL